MLIAPQGLSPKRAQAEYKAVSSFSLIRSRNLPRILALSPIISFKGSAGQALTGSLLWERSVPQEPLRALLPAAAAGPVAPKRCFDSRSPQCLMLSCGACLNVAASVCPSADSGLLELFEIRDRFPSSAPRERGSPQLAGSGRPGRREHTCGGARERRIPRSRHYPLSALISSR